MILGATTVLTLVTMGFGGRASLPRVTYATALDWFIVMCFAFVFTAMVEYACVNFVDHKQAEQIHKIFKEKLREQKSKRSLRVGLSQNLLFILKLGKSLS